MSDHPQIHPVYHLEAAWLHLTPSFVLISQVHPNHRFVRIITDLLDQLIRLHGVEIELQWNYKYM